MEAQMIFVLVTCKEESEMRWDKVELEVAIVWASSSVGLLLN